MRKHVRRANEQPARRNSAKPTSLRSLSIALRFLLMSRPATSKFENELPAWDAVGTTSLSSVSDMARLPYVPSLYSLPVR